MIHQMCTWISYSIQVTLCTLLLLTLKSVVCDIYCTPEKHEYYFSQLNKCRSCDRCIVGEGTDENSEVTFDTEFGALTCKSCKPCDKGFFSRKRSYNCKPCRDCAAKGRHTRLQCTRLKNTVCGDRIQQIESTSRVGPVFEVVNITTRTPCEGCNKDKKGTLNNIDIEFGLSYPVLLTLISVVVVGVPVIIVVAIMKGRKHRNRREETGERSIGCTSKRDSTSTEDDEELEPLSMASSFSSSSGSSNEVNGIQKQTVFICSPSEDSPQTDLNSLFKYSSLQSASTDIAVTSLSSDGILETSKKFANPSYYSVITGDKCNTKTAEDNTYSDATESDAERHFTISPNVPRSNCKVTWSSGKQQCPGIVSGAGHQDKHFLERKQSYGNVCPQVNAAMEEEDACLSTTIAWKEERPLKLNNKSKDNRLDNLKQIINRFSRFVAAQGIVCVLCRELGVSTTDLDIIADDYRGNVTEQAYRSLNKWTEKDPDASLSKLKQALIKIDCVHLLNKLNG